MTEHHDSGPILQVRRSEVGMALQDFLAVRLGVSQRRAKRMLDEKRVWVNRQCVWMARHRLRMGDGVRTATGPGTPDNKDPVLKVLYRDAHYLVVDKPAGYVSVGQGRGIEEILRRHLGTPALRVAHRLDRETSGCLLVALTEAAFDAAVTVFKERKVRKTYHAIVVGSFDRSSTTITDPVEGAPALTHLRCLRNNAAASLLVARIETGRTHQIRRHLAGVRHPVLGDRDHGLKRVIDPRVQAVPRLMLHALEISLPHPLEADAVLLAHAPQPMDFRRCLAVFDLDSRSKRPTTPAARRNRPARHRQVR